MKTLKTVIVVIFLLFALSGCLEAEPEIQMTAEALELLKLVDVNFELQQQFDDQGRQKVVVWVINESGKALTQGTLRTTIVTWDGKDNGTRLFQRTHQETFTITGLQSGTRTWGVMWIRMQPDSEVSYIWSGVRFAE